MTKVQAAAKMIEVLMRDYGVTGCFVLIDVKGSSKNGFSVETGTKMVVNDDYDIKSIPVIHNLKLELDNCAKQANAAYDLLKREIPELDEMLRYEELDK